MQSLEYASRAASRTPPALHRLGDPLLDLQLWMLGQDRLHPEGNALARYGFQRGRHPEGHGSSGYLLPLNDPPGTGLVCWGYGIYLGPVRLIPPGDAAPSRATGSPPGAPPLGVVLERHAFGPRVLTAPLALPVRAKAALGARHVPRAPLEQQAAGDGLRRVATLLADYERWALRTLGHAHRLQALALLPRHKRRRLPATPSLADGWDALRDALPCTIGAA
jgi:hypothetical protein